MNGPEHLEKYPAEPWKSRVVLDFHFQFTLRIHTSRSQRGLGARLEADLGSCRVLCRSERVQVDEAAIRQYYWVTLRSGRFTAANRGADWKRNEQCVLVA